MDRNELKGEKLVNVAIILICIVVAVLLPVSMFMAIQLGKYSDEFGERLEALDERLSDIVEFGEKLDTLDGHLLEIVEAVDSLNRTLSQVDDPPLLTIYIANMGWSDIRVGIYIDKEYLAQVTVPHTWIDQQYIVMRQYEVDWPCVVVLTFSDCPDSEFVFGLGTITTPSLFVWYLGDADFVYEWC